MFVFLAVTPCGISLDQVTVHGRIIKIHAACVGGKGDWPYVRKCFGLKPGFQVPRICHMCPKTVPWQPLLLNKTLEQLGHRVTRVKQLNLWVPF